MSLISFTPRRSDAAPLVAAAAAFFLYGISGLLLVPVIPAIEQPTGCAPYIDDSTWKISTHSTGISPERYDRAHVPAGLKEELDDNAANLSRLMELLARPELAPFEKLPEYRTVLQAGALLTARGVILSDAGQGDQAVESWVAAARLGRAIARVQPRVTTVFEGLIGSRVGCRALSAILDHAGKGRLTPGEARRVLRELADRRTDIRTLAHYVRGTGVSALHALDRGIEQGGTGTIYPFRSFIEDRLRAFMPVRRTDRIAFLKEVRAHVVRELDVVLESAHGNTIPSYRFPEYDAPSRMVPALLWRDSAVRLCARALLWLTLPDFERARAELDQLERVATDLAGRCQSVLESGTPLMNASPPRYRFHPSGFWNVHAADPVSYFRGQPR